MIGGVAIRPAAGHEIAIVAILFREYAAALGVDLSYQGFEAELAGLPGPYASPQGILLLAVNARAEPLGCVGMRSLPEHGACEMKRLYARPAARGSGIGQTLARAAIEAARLAGYRTMRLDTLSNMAPAQALYRKLGFVETPAYYNTPIASTIFMCKSLGQASPPAERA